MFPEGHGAPRAARIVGAAAPFVNALVVNAKGASDELWKRRSYNPDATKARRGCSSRCQSVRGASLAPSRTRIPKRWLQVPLPQTSNSHSAPALSSRWLEPWRRSRVARVPSDPHTATALLTASYLFRAQVYTGRRTT